MVPRRRRHCPDCSYQRTVPAPSKKLNDEINTYVRKDCPFSRHSEIAKDPEHFAEEWSRKKNQYGCEPNWLQLPLTPPHIGVGSSRRRTKKWPSHVPSRDGKVSGPSAISNGIFLNLWRLEFIIDGTGFPRPLYLARGSKLEWTLFILILLPPRRRSTCPVCPARNYVIHRDRKRKKKTSNPLWWKPFSLPKSGPDKPALANAPKTTIKSSVEIIVGHIHCDTIAFHARESLRMYCERGFCVFPPTRMLRHAFSDAVRRAKMKICRLVKRESGELLLWLLSAHVHAHICGPCSWCVTSMQEKMVLRLEAAMYVYRTRWWWILLPA